MIPNSKAISSRQLFYLLTIELFCLISLFLPEFLSRRLKQDAPVGLLLGFLFACVFALILGVFWKKYGDSFLVGKKRGVLQDALTFIFFIQTVLITAFVLNITWEIVRIFLLPDVGRFIILVTFYAVCVFASIKGISVRARMAEFCGRFFVVLFIILLLISIKKIDLNQYEMLLMHSPGTILNGGYEVFLLFESVIFSLFASTVLTEKKSYKKVVIKSLGISFILGLIMLLVLMGTFGVDYIGVMDYPAIRLLRNLTQNGGFLSRLDVWMIGVWLVSLFFFASGGIQYSKMLFQSVMDENSSGKRNAVLTIMIFLITWIFGNMQNSYYIYRNYMYYIGTPLLVIVLLLLIMKKNGGNKVEKR